MQLRDDLGHLTYCTNVHRGESLADLHTHLLHAAAVRRRVVGDRGFGVGLRVSHEAACELESEEARRELRERLASHGLYVFTLNGFPHGRFHGTRVKERVYRPDWQEPERLDYSDRLAHLLADLLPHDGSIGSISTVPGAAKARVGPDGEMQIATYLLDHCATLVRIERATGRTVQLALEPEPGCFLETVDETVRFFEDALFSQADRLAAQTGASRGDAELALRRHLTVCVDACHAAVEFEDPELAIDRLESAGIAIGKLQISAGLVIAPVDAARRAALAGFAEDVYLHQVVARRGSELRRYLDLPEALGDPRAHADDEWRVHFHVPIFHRDLGSFGSTVDFLERLLARHRRAPFTSHLEVETYTWDVLPERLRLGAVEDSIAREIRWVHDQLLGRSAS